MKTILSAALILAIGMGITGCVTTEEAAAEPKAKQKQFRDIKPMECLELYEKKRMEYYFQNDQIAPKEDCGN